MNRRWGLFAVIWILILVTIYIGDRFVRDVFLTAEVPRAITPRGDLAAVELTTVGLFQTAAPSVVYIFTQDSAGGGAGSGFMWDRAGHVVTNFHVVEGSRTVSVRLDDGEAVHASVIGTAPRLRPGGGAACRHAEPDEADPGRYLGRPQGRPIGVRHRQPIRAVTDLDDRGDQRAQPAASDRQQPRGARRHPNRCGDQPGEFRRAAARFGRQADRG